MKILLSGKGGSGKSTISALLAKTMANRGYMVLVMDCDESNFRLHRQLGMDLPEDFMNYFGGRKEILEQMIASFQNPDAKDGPMKLKIFDKTWTLSDIPKEYSTKKNGIKLLAVGKIHEFGEGCACPMGALSSWMLEKNKIAGIIPANNDVFKACLAGEELDLRLAEIKELANVLGGEK